jgi:hypothetical protein
MTNKYKLRGGGPDLFKGCVLSFTLKYLQEQGVDWMYMAQMRNKLLAPVTTGIDR